MKTVLHDRHEELGARIVDFAGWMLPVQFEGVLAEHRHCRSEAALFDCGHMGQFLFRGPDAAAQLARIGTQNAVALKVGRCRYGFLLNEEGGVIDDTILMRLGEEEFLLVVNAGTRDGDLAWIRSHLSGNLEIVNRSEQGWGKIDLQGPAACRVLMALEGIESDGDFGDLKFFGVTTALRDGVGLVVSRTGYTGELGYEIMAPSEALVPVFDALIADGRVKPAGLGARDSLRLEMCYPLYGHELSTDRSPLQAGMGPFLDLERDFIGAGRLRRTLDQGVDEALIAFAASTRRRANPGDAIMLDGAPVGVVTSGAFSPSLERSIGMGYVRADLAEAGRELVVDTGRARIEIVVEDKPLYRDGTCRTKDPRS